MLGKWLGAYRMVPLLAIMPALVIGCGAFHRDWKLCWVALLMIAYVLSAGAAITSLGIAMAISFSRLGRAVERDCHALCTGYCGTLGPARADGRRRGRATWQWQALSSGPARWRSTS